MDPHLVARVQVVAHLLREAGDAEVQLGERGQRVRPVGGDHDGARRLELLEQVALDRESAFR